MKRLPFLLLLLALPFGAGAQTIHVDAAATPTCGPQSCVLQKTTDPNPVTSATSNEKLLLFVNEKIDYTVTVPATGNYKLSVRLDGDVAVHFEVPAGTNASGAITLANATAWQTIASGNAINLAAGTATIRVVVDSAQATCCPAMHYFELAGIAPAQTAFTVAPSSVLFPSTQSGTMAVPLTVTITNTGTAPLTLSLVQTQQLAGQGSPAGDFGVFPTSTVVAPLQPGNSTTFLITFMPRITGSIAGNLLVQAAGQTTTVPLTGTAQ